MMKTPEQGGPGPENDDEHNEKLRVFLRKKGMTESQITDMVIRLDAEGIFQALDESKRPGRMDEFIQEQLGDRKLSDLDKVRLAAVFDELKENLKKHFGVDGEGKIKKD